MSSTMLCLASISTLCCISADRYFAVVRPMRYKHVLTPKRALCMLIIVWLGSLSLSCLPLITNYEYHSGINNCSPVWYRSCGLYSFMTIFAFGVPLVTLLFTYGMIFYSIRRHTKRVSHLRVSSCGHSGLRESTLGTEVTGTGRERDSFLSISAVDDAKQNCHRIPENEISPNNTPGNSMHDCLEVEDSTKSRHHDNKFRSHSAGCNHVKPDENLLPFLFQMKAAATPRPLEANLEPRPRSCSVSLRFSIGELVTGTVSAMFCPNGGHSNENEHAQSTAKCLSYTDVHSIEPNELAFPESQNLPVELPNDFNWKRTRSHSISLTVTAASTPINGPEYPIPVPFSLNGFMSVQHDDSTDLLRRLRESNSSPVPQDTQQTLSRHVNQLQLPPIVLPTPTQVEKVPLPSPLPPKNFRSRSRSLSFDKSSEKGKKNTQSLHLPPVHKSSSPLLRLRAITQFKRKLRVNALPREYKIAKIGFILVLVFFLSWGPYMMVHNCQRSSETPLWLYRAAMWLVYLSCVVNPIVYALLSKHIRLAFSSHLKSWKKNHSGNLQAELPRQRLAISRRQEFKV